MSEFEFKCPNCGNDGKTDDPDRSIDHVEWVPTHRRVTHIDGSKISLDYENYEDYTDAAKDPGFYCTACDYQWPVPNEVKII